MEMLSTNACGEPHGHVWSEKTRGMESVRHAPRARKRFMVVTYLTRSKARELLERSGGGDIMMMMMIMMMIMMPRSSLVGTHEITSFTTRRKQTFGTRVGELVSGEDGVGSVWE